LFFAILLLIPSVALGATVEVLGTPFPSDLFTVADATHLTGLRVNLPSPADCATHLSDCQDVTVLNTLDGFNLQPRISIAFTGAIDPASVSSSTIYLVSLGSTTDGSGAGKVVGINQAIWEPAANTLHVESDELLDQHTRYLLVVTRGVHGDDGKALGVGDFRGTLNFGQTHDDAVKTYRKSLLSAIHAAGVAPGNIAAASIFTTQSATAILEKIRDQIKSATPAPASFLLGPGGSRTVFPASTIVSILFNQQRTTGSALTSVSVPSIPGFLAPAALAFVLGRVPTPGPLQIPNAIGTIAFGQYQSPDYLDPLTRLLPAYGTATDVPEVFAHTTIQFNLFLPASPKPVGGYPVAIFGHGFGDNKNNSPLFVASVLANHGIATIAINVVGHGRGAASTLTVNTLGGAVTFPAGSRGYDQDGNGVIDSTEGVNALAPLVGNRDGLRQTVVDLMQLVRVIQVGVDVDGDGVTDLDASRIYYFGQSFGGIYGTKFIALEPDIQAGVPNVAGGAIIEVARLGVFRGLVALSLLLRTPSLSNTGPTFYPILGTSIPGFDENIPLRTDPLVVAIDTVPGASAIQKVLDDTEWVSQSGNPVAYAPHIRRNPLEGMSAKPVIFQFAKGDQTVPNPTTTAILRAGDLADRATYFRNDLNMPGANPHTFLTFGVGITPGLQAQHQIGIFFETGVMGDPDGTGPLFEVPIAPPLPEELNF
jgi:dienelactone hydrolase